MIFYFLYLLENASLLKKKDNVLKITKTGARKLSNITNTIAMSEGLYAHGYSAMLRK